MIGEDWWIKFHVAIAENVCRESMTSKFELKYSKMYVRADLNTKRISNGCDEKTDDEFRFHKPI